MHFDYDNFVITEPVANQTDTTPPEVYVYIDPPDPIFGQYFWLMANATDETGLSGIQIFLDDNMAPTECSIGHCEYASYNLPVGNHTYYAVANDTSGNVGRDPVAGSKIFYVRDVTPPVISVHHYPEYPHLGENITIVANASDDVTLSNIAIYVDGENVESCFSDVCTYSNSNLPSGNHTYYAIATDTSGNIGRDPSDGNYFFNIGDTAPPTVYVYHAPSNPTQDQDVIITAIATDNVNVSSIEIFFNDIIVATCYSDICRFFLYNLSIGNYTYYATANDTSGNTVRNPVNGAYSFTVESGIMPVMTTCWNQTFQKCTTVEIRSLNGPITDKTLFLVLNDTVIKDFGQAQKNLTDLIIYNSTNAANPAPSDALLNFFVSYYNVSGTPNSIIFVKIPDVSNVNSIVYKISLAWKNDTPISSLSNINRTSTIIWASDRFGNDVENETVGTTATFLNVPAGKTMDVLTSFGSGGTTGTKAVRYSTNGGITGPNSKYTIAPTGKVLLFAFKYRWGSDVNNDMGPVMSDSTPGRVCEWDFKNTSGPIKYGFSTGTVSANSVGTPNFWYEMDNWIRWNAATGVSTAQIYINGTFVASNNDCSDNFWNGGWNNDGGMASSVFFETPSGDALIPANLGIDFDDLIITESIFPSETVMSFSPTITMNVNVSVSHFPANPALHSPVKITATTSGEDILNISIFLDGVSVATCYSSSCIYLTSNLSAGNHTYYATVIDSSGSTGRDPIIGSKLFTVSSIPDTAPPSVLVVHLPMNPALNDTVVITANASDNIEVSSIDIFLDGSNVKKCYSTYCAYNASGIDFGNHTYYATSTDTSGNVGRDPLTGSKSFFAMDITPPTIYVYHSPLHPLIGQNVTITANATDNVAVSSILLVIDNTNIVICTSSTCVYSSVPNAGQHTYYAMAVDTSGNTENDPVLGDKTFYVNDTMSPIISNIAFSSISTNSAMITWITNDASWSLVKYGTTSGIYTNLASGPGGIIHFVQLSGLTEATRYYFVVNSTDVSRNSAQSIEMIFTTHSTSLDGDSRLPRKIATDEGQNVA